MVAAAPLLDRRRRFPAPVALSEGRAPPELAGAAAGAREAEALRRRIAAEPVRQVEDFEHGDVLAPLVRARDLERRAIVAQLGQRPQILPAHRCSRFVPPT